MARHIPATASFADAAPTVDRAANPAWGVALGLSFIGCGLALGLALVAIATAGPLSPAQGDQAIG